MRQTTLNKELDYSVFQEAHLSTFSNLHFWGEMNCFSEVIHPKLSCKPHVNGHLKKSYENVFMRKLKFDFLLFLVKTRFEKSSSLVGLWDELAQYSHLMSQNKEETFSRSWL